MKISRLLIFLISALFAFAFVFSVYKVKSDQNNSKPMFEKASFGGDIVKDDPWARIEYENRMLRNPTTGKIPDNIRSKELAYSKTLPAHESNALYKGNSLSWTLRGPINRGGRTRALGIDIRTNSPGSITIIAGGVSGGLWKSSNDGTTWANKLSPDSIHSATCIAQDIRSGHQDTWYVGTGEFSGNSANGGGGAFFRGDGIFKSTDNGESWTLLSATSDGQVQAFNSYFRYVSNVAVNPINGDVYAAASGTIQKSTNGGDNWSLSKGTGSISSTPSDVQITSLGIVYATIPSSLSTAGIWRTPDNGTTWTNIKPSGFPSTYGRNVIAIDPNNENIVYFWVYTAAGASGTELWRYTYVSGNGSGAGGTWEDLTSKLPTTIPPNGQTNVGNLNVQGSYDMVMKVQPGNSNFVIIGGTNLYRSQDAFATQIDQSGWIGGYATINNISQYANQHPDQHSFVFLKGANSNFAYSGHDGGLSKTTDITASTVSWSSLNQGYVTSQFYSVAIDKNTANSNVIAGGLQDNGNYITFSNDYNVGWTDWTHGGDGGYSAVTANGTGTIYTVYLEAQNGWLWRQLYDNTGSQLADNLIEPSYTGQFSFINPFVLDPNNSSIMYFAQGDSVLRSTNVNAGIPNWSVMSHATTGGNGSISAFGVAKNVANRLYVGGTDGTVLRIDGANTGDPTATNLTTALTTAGAASGAYVNCITVDPQNADRVFVVYSNYSVRSLFESTNGGTTWSNISGNLEENSDGTGNGPSCRWLDLIEDGGNTTVYVATSTGLYSTTALNGTSTNWVQEGASVIGNSVCPMVHARSSDGLVVVGTHGSGVYSANQTLTGIESVTSSIPSSYSLNQNYPNPFNPSTKIKFNLPQTNNVKLTIYDITGRKVKELVNQQLAAGVHTVDFDATNLASGTYIYRIQAGNFVQSKKMILLK